MHERSERDPKVSLWSGVLRWKRQKKSAPAAEEGMEIREDDSRLVTEEVYFWAMPWV